MSFVFVRICGFYYACVLYLYFANLREVFTITPEEIKNGCKGGRFYGRAGFLGVTGTFRIEYSYDGIKYAFGHWENIMSVPATEQALRARCCDAAIRSWDIPSHRYCSMPVTFTLAVRGWVYDRRTAKQIQATGTDNEKERKLKKNWRNIATVYRNCEQHGGTAFY